MDIWSLLWFVVVWVRALRTLGINWRYSFSVVFCNFAFCCLPCCAFRHCQALCVPAQWHRLGAMVHVMSIRIHGCGSLTFNTVLRGGNTRAREAVFGRFPDGAEYNGHLAGFAWFVPEPRELWPPGKVAVLPWLNVHWVPVIRNPLSCCWLSVRERSDFDSLDFRCKNDVAGIHEFCIEHRFALKRNKRQHPGAMRCLFVAVYLLIRFNWPSVPFSPILNTWDDFMWRSWATFWLLVLLFFMWIKSRPISMSYDFLVDLAGFWSGSFLVCFWFWRWASRWLSCFPRLLSGAPVCFLLILFCSVRCQNTDHECFRLESIMSRVCFLESLWDCSWVKKKATHHEQTSRFSGSPDCFPGRFWQWQQHPNLLCGTWFPETDLSVGKLF